MSPFSNIASHLGCHSPDELDPGLLVRHTLAAVRARSVSASLWSSSDSLGPELVTGNGGQAG
jgi:hypothetical protein